MKSEAKFHNGQSECTLLEVLDSIKNFLEEDPKSAYSLVIGTDSHEKEEEKINNKITDRQSRPKKINLVTAIVVHRKGFGGKYYWRRKTVGNIFTLRDKIYAETLESLDFAKEFIPLVKKKLNGTSPDYDLEIHVDVGQHGDTREMIKEVVGMVTGHGYIAKTKPDSYAASYVADKHT